ncbi:structural cement protein Gp24 [Brevibacillus ginsengisoli]|uniref:structural cement protein Gp24 n=1 Tax=Brevibacillus ginsengisoli TaxID=363854 RepID=UPI003CF972C5
MPGSVVGKSLNLGYPGNISRSADAIITNRIVKLTDAANINFGDPVVLNGDNTYSAFGATGTAATFAGIAVREVKQSTDYFAGQGFYKPGQPCDVVERGSVTVVCNVGTPTAGGDVYVRITANGSVPNGVVNGFEAAADGANTIKLPGVKWKTGKLDSNRVAEVTITQRNNP